MAKENLTCNKCGAVLSRLESEPDTYICLHCGNKQVIKEDNFIINHHYQINQNITKYVYGPEKIEFPELIAKAETYYQLQDYQQALKLFEQATKENPINYQGWWGRARCKISTKNLHDCHEDYLRACELADTNTKQQITMEYEKLRPSLLQQTNYTNRDFSYRAEFLVKNHNNKHLLLRLVLLSLGAIGSILAIIGWCILLLTYNIENALLIILFGIGCGGMEFFCIFSINNVYWKFKITDFINKIEHISLSNLCQRYPGLFRGNFAKTTCYVVNLIKKGYLSNYEIKNGVIQRIQLKTSD